MPWIVAVWPPSAVVVVMVGKPLGLSEAIKAIGGILGKVGIFRGIKRACRRSVLRVGEKEIERRVVAYCVFGVVATQCRDGR